MLQDLYGSLCEEVRFEQPLHRLGALFGSSISGLHTEDFGAHRGRLTLVGDVSSEEYLEFTQAYTHRWNGQNLWMERSVEGFLQQGYQIGDAVVGEAELRSSSYYRHFLKPLDIRHGMGINIWRDDRLNMAVASFHRGHGDEAFDAQDAVLIGHVRPHLANAYAIYRRFAHLQDATASLRACFDRTPLGMLLLDADGRVLEANASGDALLSNGTLRRGIDGRLAFGSVRMQQQFSDALQRCLGPQAPPQSLSFAEPGAGAAQQRVLHLCSVPGGVSGGMPARARVLVFVATMQAGAADAMARDIVRQVLGLSPTEARVVLALREHGDTGLVAQSLGLTVSTVRSHIKSIHGKLDIRRNNELLLLVERLLGSRPAGG